MYCLKFLFPLLLFISLECSAINGDSLFIIKISAMRNNNEMLVFKQNAPISNIIGEICGSLVGGTTAVVLFPFDIVNYALCCDYQKSYFHFFSTQFSRAIYSGSYLATGSPMYMLEELFWNIPYNYLAIE